MYCQYTGGDNFVIIHQNNLYIVPTKKVTIFFYRRNLYKARHKTPEGRQDGAERKWIKEANWEVEIDTMKRTERQIKTGTWTRSDRKEQKEQSKRENLSLMQEAEWDRNKSGTNLFNVAMGNADMMNMWVDYATNWLYHGQGSKWEVRHY